MDPAMTADALEVDLEADGPVLGPRRPLEEAEMDITPMIDITFLLLIFFIVASRVDSDASVKLPPARHGTAVASKSSIIVTLGPGKGDRAAVYLGDGTDAKNLVAGGSLADEEEAITDYIDEAMQTGTKEQVIIKAGRQVKHRDVNRAATAVGAAADEVPLYVAVMEEG